MLNKFLRMKFPYLPGFNLCTGVIIPNYTVVHISIGGSPRKKSNIIPLRILIALLRSKRSSAELSLRSGLICAG